MQYLLGMDNMTGTNKFDLVNVVNTFYQIVRTGENLLKAKLVSLVILVSVAYFLTSITMDCNALFFLFFC
jgi:hypothetical protein